jgi:hypothetical protein
MDSEPLGISRKVRKSSSRADQSFQALKPHFWFSVYIDGVEIVDGASLIFLRISVENYKLIFLQESRCNLPSGTPTQALPVNYERPVLGCFGDDLAKWLTEQLRSKGFKHRKCCFNAYLLDKALFLQTGTLR